MKLIFLITSLSFLLCSEYTEKYYLMMDKGMDLFEKCESESDYLNTSNYFYRISQVMKTDWLSSYYYAYSNTKISMFQDDPDIKEEYLDKAFDILTRFEQSDVDLVDSLALSEIYTLKAMIYVGKIFINPMVNGMKYGPLSGQSIEQAIKYYPNNPRPYFLDGQSKFYTPSAFGGGVDKAMPLLKKSLDNYSKFKAKKYWPNWGISDCKTLYDKAVKQNEK
tara:strand:+ start:2870 stop:3532 length:663 start_codon:yes stop_codon:yes gene_type:complete